MAKEYTRIRSISPALADYYELTKPGITLSVLFSMSVGYVIASIGPMDGLERVVGFDVKRFLFALLGTWLVAAGTAAHNMFLERGLDGLMPRTSKRPLVEQRISEARGMVFSFALILAGLATLFALVNVPAGIVSLSTTGIYLLAYTPLKRYSAANVLVGAIAGALPVVGGWAAVTGSVLDYGMWILFWIMFLWQIPHVMAIAWLYRDQYEHAGFQMLPRNDASGLKAAGWIVFSLVAMLPTVWKVQVLDLGGWVYLAGALLLSVGYLYHGVRFAINRERDRAKRLMFFSFLFLPGVWAVLLAERLVILVF